jgi:hypothetical protein
VGQCKSAAEHGAAASQRVRVQRARLREVQVSMGAAAKDGARSRAWEAHAAAAGALTGQSADQGATSDPGRRKRLLELNAQAVDSALGFGALAPGAHLQHELTSEIERAKHKALWASGRER